MPHPKRWIERLDPRLDALLSADAAIESLAGGFSWVEGPVWDERESALLFSDVPHNVIHRWRDGLGVDVFLRPSGYTGPTPFTGPEPGSNGLAFDRDGRLVMCQHGDRRIVRVEEGGTWTVLADRFAGKRLHSPNDLILRSNGDLYFTDPPYGLPRVFDDPERELDFQGVYRIATDGTLHLVVRDLEAPNGIAFSPDETILYVSNSASERPVWVAYPVLPDGSVGDGSVFANASVWASEGEGAPDGFEVDVHGNLFVTGPGGIHVLAPDGTRLGRIVTGRSGNVAWGEDGGTLFVASNHEILRIRTRTKGL